MKIYTEIVLRRTVVEIPDVPAFLGNRIGFQFINQGLLTAEKFRYNGGIDYIDAILGPFTGRLMAPLVTANFVGLDVHKAIIENLYKNTNDYMHESFQIPDFVNRLIEEGKTGRKASAGLYRTLLHDSGVIIHQVFDIEHGYYREKIKYSFPFIEEMLGFLQTGDYEEAFRAMVLNRSLEARLCCEFLLRYIMYSLYITRELGCDVEVADDVMATGFHWCPPLAMIEAFETVSPIKELCIQRLDKRTLLKTEWEKLLLYVKNSKYDYRKFILAKR